VACRFGVTTKSSSSALCGVCNRSASADEEGEERHASAEGGQAVTRVEAIPAAVDQAAVAGERAYRAPFGAAPAVANM
jgi:hypothetical protein